jgi:chemotaxis protein histidine kinase CheA/ActR/RegA family two-component response regulator
MADFNNKELELQFWNSILQMVLRELGDDIDQDNRELVKKVMVRLTSESLEKSADEFPLWDLRSTLSDIGMNLTDEDADASAVSALVYTYGENFIENFQSAISNDDATLELMAYTESISEDDVAAFDALTESGEAEQADSDEEADDEAVAEDSSEDDDLLEIGEDEEVDPEVMAAINEAASEVDIEGDVPPMPSLDELIPDEGSSDAIELPGEEVGDEGEQFSLEEMAAAAMEEAEGDDGDDDAAEEQAAEGVADDILEEVGMEDMSDLLPPDPDMAELPELEGELEVMGELPELEGESGEDLLADLTAGAGLLPPEEEGEGDTDDDPDAAVLAQLESMDLSQMSEEQMAEMLGATSEDDELVDSEIDLDEEALANLEQELEGAEAMAGESDGADDQPVAPAAEKSEATMSPEDLVRARMIRISEAVEELSDDPGERALISQLIDHFNVITRPILRMGFRTFASLSDALVSALQFCRDNDLEAPSTLCNNLRELVTTLAEVVEGRWSKYKTFYWLINKLNTTIRQMEEMVEERDEQLDFGGGYEADEGDEIDDQIAARREENEGRQRAELTDLQEIFIQEANEHIDLLNRNLLLAERNPEDQEIIYAIMRSAHSVKGSANISKYTDIGSLGHAMEDVMVAIRDNQLTLTPAVNDIMLYATDRLQNMIAGVEYGDEVDKAPINELKTKLNSLAEELQTNPDKYKAGADAVDKALQKKVGLEVPKKEEQTDTRTEAERQRDTVRVDYQDLNSLLNQAAELVINRTRLSGQIDSMRGMIENLSSEKKKLRSTEQRLDNAIEEVSREMNDFLNTSLSFGSLGQSALAGDAASSEAASLMTRLNQARGALSRLLRIRESGMLGDFSDAEFDRFSEFDIIWRDIREGITHIDDIIDHFEIFSSNLDQNISRISIIANDLHEQIMRIRMIPVGQIFKRFPRTVRDTSRQLSKKIALKMKGEETPLDKTIIEELADPMIHLVRNACGHGIELPEEREEMGKEPEGTIFLDARQEGNQVVIEIRDDGKGIDVEAIKRKAIERRIMTEDQANRASENDLVNLIFAPGFSTAAETTDISGRGVGMDVVKTSITKLKGIVTVSSELGEGTTFTIRLPLTLAISQALLFSASNSRFAIQLSAVDETMMIREDTIMRTMGTEIIKLRDEVLPIVRLSQVLSLGAPEGEDSSERPVIIVSTSQHRRVAVMVDRLVGREEIVVKNLGSHLKNVRFISGGTILGDGAVTLILDISAIVDQVQPMQVGDISYSPEDKSAAGFDEESYRKAVEGAREKVASVEFDEDGDDAPSLDEVLAQGTGEGVEQGPPSILVTDDSISIRRFVGSILESAGYRVTLANDGVDAMEKLKERGRFDLLLTDLEMPRMHGYELIAEVKQNIAYKNIPIIILTGRAGEKHSRKGMELGAAAFLVKPFNEEELLSEISKNISRTPA